MFRVMFSNSSQTQSEREREYKTIKGGICIDRIVGVLRLLCVTETLSRWEAEEGCRYAVTIDTHKKFQAIPYQTSHLLFVTVWYLLAYLLSSLAGKLV